MSEDTTTTPGGATAGAEEINGLLSRLQSAGRSRNPQLYLRVDHMGRAGDATLAANVIKQLRAALAAAEARAARAEGAVMAYGERVREACAAMLDRCAEDSAAEADRSHFDSRYWNDRANVQVVDAKAVRNMPLPVPANPAGAGGKGDGE